MDRSSLKVTDEEVSEEFGRVIALLALASKKPSFTRLMDEASRKGLNWIQALEYVIATVAC